MSNVDVRIYAAALRYEKAHGGSLKMRRLKLNLAREIELAQAGQSLS